MESWYTQATTVPELTAEICFQLQPHFYYGPDRPADIAANRLVEPLTPPVIPRVVPSMVRTTEALGHEDQLASYYEQIVMLARKYKRPFNSIRHYFWLRFWLWSEEHKVHISFPWYDSFSEINRFIDAVASTESGLVDHDLEQGWEMEVHSENGTLYVRERDPDANETCLTVATPRDGLLVQLVSLQKRTNAIVKYLTESLGADVWTSYVRNEPAFRDKRAWWRRW